MDRGILRDHSGSIVLDLPFGLRGGIPVDGVPFFPQALVMATEDGHPRSIAYTSRVPQPTINAINKHPFYAALIDAQHEVPQKCPWRVPGQPESLNLCDHPYGVSLPGAVVAVNKVSEYLTPTRLAAAKADAARMNIGWAVVWKRNGSVSKFLLTFLHKTGFNVRLQPEDPRQGHRAGLQAGLQAGISLAVRATARCGQVSAGRWRGSALAVGGRGAVSRPSAARPRSTPRRPRARPARSSAVSPARMRSWRDCHACQSRSATARPCGVR